MPDRSRDSVASDPVRRSGTEGVGTPLCMNRGFWMFGRKVTGGLSAAALAMFATAGIASAEDIDKALKLGLNHPMGPFELVDLVGLDVRLNILEYLHSTLGEKYRPNPLLRKFVEEGRFGRKVGRGVYDYTQKKA